MVSRLKCSVAFGSVTGVEEERLDAAAALVTSFPPSPDAKGASARSAAPVDGALASAGMVGKGVGGAEEVSPSSLATAASASSSTVKELERVVDGVIDAESRRSNSPTVVMVLAEGVRVLDDEAAGRLPPVSSLDTSDPFDFG